MLDAAGDKPVTFRTLDIGGDKVLPYMRNVEEENPALGLARHPARARPARAVAHAIARSAARRRQPRAEDHVSDDLDGARNSTRPRNWSKRELTHLRRHGHKLPDAVEVGSMVEVPSLLYQLDELLERVDFLSVGSNDLVQFLYAIDRGNPRVSGRFDPLSAPVLRALKDIADKAQAYKKPVTLCGELASQPIGALALAAIGYRSLSLTPSAVGPVKAMLLDLDCRKAAGFLCPLIEHGQARGRSARNWRNSPPATACRFRVMSRRAIYCCHRPRRRMIEYPPPRRRSSIRRLPVRCGHDKEN